MDPVYMTKSIVLVGNTLGSLCCGASQQKGLKSPSLFGRAGYVWVALTNCSEHALIVHAKKILPFLVLVLISCEPDAL